MKIRFKKLIDSIQLDTAFAVFKEFLFVFICATSGFWMGGFVLFVHGGANNGLRGLWEQISITFSNGELLIFTITMISPVFYFIFSEPDGARPLPGRIFFGTIAGILLALSVCVLSLLKISQVQPEAAVRISFIFTLSALAIRYIGMLLHRKRLPRPPNEEELRKPEREFLAEYAQHRGGQ